MSEWLGHESVRVDDDPDYRRYLREVCWPFCGQKTLWQRRGVDPILRRRVMVSHWMPCILGRGHQGDCVPVRPNGEHDCERNQCPEDIPL